MVGATDGRPGRTREVHFQQYWDLARMERAKPAIGQRSSLATTAEELLLRQSCRRSHT